MASSTNSSSTAPDKYDQYLKERLAQTISQVKWVELLSFFLTLAVFVLGALFVLCLIDAWVVELNIWARWGALTVLAAGVIGFSIYKALPFLLWRVNPRYAAKKLEEGRPELKNSVINYLTTVDEQGGQIDPSVLKKLSQSAARDVANIPLDVTVDRSPMILAGYALAGVVALFAIYKVVSPKDPFQTIGRVILPSADLMAPARVKISDVKPGDEQKFFGESVEISARIRGLKDGEFPRLLVTSESGTQKDQPVTMIQEPDSDRFKVEIGQQGGLRESFVYQIQAGDATTVKYQIDVRTCPTVFLEKVEYSPPAYTGISPRTEMSPNLVSAVEGTVAKLWVRTNLPIETAYLKLYSISTENNDGQESPDAVNPDSQNFDSSKLTTAKSIKLEVVDDSQAFAELPLLLNGKRTQTRYSHFQVVFTAEDGSKSENENLTRIEVIRDLSPEIEVIAPVEKVIEIPQDRSERIEVSAVDPDHGLTAVTIIAEQKGNRLFEKSVFKSPSPLGIKGNQVGGFEFRPSEYGLSDGDEIVWFGQAEDNRALGDEQTLVPNRTRTENYKFVITAPLKNPSDSRNDEDPKKEKDPENPDKNQDPNPDQKSDNQKENQKENQKDKQEGKQDPGKNQDPKAGKDSGNDSKEQSRNQNDNQPGKSQPENGKDQDGKSSKDGKSGSKQDAGNQEKSGGKSGKQDQSPDKGKSNDGKQNGSSQKSSDSKSGKTDPGKSNDNQGGKGSKSEKSDNSGQKKQSSDPSNGKSSDVNKESDSNSEASRENPNNDSTNAENQNSKGEPQGKPQNSKEAFERLKKYFDEKKDQDSTEPSNDTQNQDPKTGNSNDEDPSKENRNDGGAGQKEKQSDSKSPGKSNTDDMKGEPAGKEKQKGDPSKGSNSQAGKDEKKQSADQKGSQNEPDRSGTKTGKKEESPQANGNKQGSKGKDKSGDPNKGTGQGNDAKENPGGKKKGDSGDDSQKGSKANGSNPKRDNKKGSESGKSDSESEKSKSNQASDDPRSKSGDADKSKSEGKNSKGEKSSDQKRDAKGQNNLDDRQPQTDSGGNTGNVTQSSSKETQDNGKSNNSSRTNQSRPETKAEKANLDYTRKTTEMVLEKLADQKEQPDPELLKDLNWTEEELREFTQKWQAMREKANAGGSKEQERFEEALKSLGLKDPDLNQKAADLGNDDRAGYRQKSGTRNVPSDFARKFRAIQKSQRKLDNE